MAEKLGAALAVLHVAPSGADDAAARPGGGGRARPAAGVREEQGDPTAAILAASGDPTVALVVLTTHGRDVEPGRDLGSVAAAVLAGATRPVLFVRPEATLQQQGDMEPVRRLLVPLDGTPTTAAILKPVTELAARLGTSVDLLYVADPGQAQPGEAGSLAGPRYVDQPQHEWPQWASEIISRLMTYCAACPANVSVQPYLSTGEVGAEIVRFAATHGDDVIVLVRRSGLESGRGKILQAILGQSPCPVMLVGRSEEAAQPG
jgi:nucleotide-binding universal stress UspA family protein